MIHYLVFSVAFLILILTFYLDRNKRIGYEGFYDPSKPDQRPFEMEDHTYDPNLFQAEGILYDTISNLDSTKTTTKSHLSELLNIIQSI